MAAPEERELTAEQTEKLLQFQVPRCGGSVLDGGSGGGGAGPASPALGVCRPPPGWGKRRSLRAEAGPAWS